MLTSTGDLQIVQLHRTDSGTYVCIADNGLGAPVERRVNVQVTGMRVFPTYFLASMCFPVNINIPTVVAWFLFSYCFVLTI